MGLNMRSWWGWFLWNWPPPMRQSSRVLLLVKCCLPELQISAGGQEVFEADDFAEWVILFHSYRKLVHVNWLLIAVRVGSLWANLLFLILPENMTFRELAFENLPTVMAVSPLIAILHDYLSSLSLDWQFLE